MLSSLLDIIVVWGGWGLGWVRVWVRIAMIGVGIAWFVVVLGSVGCIGFGF